MRALPLSIVCVSNERSSAVAVWAAASELVQRTRPPFRTVTVTGSYLNDLMSTVALPWFIAAGATATGFSAAPPQPLASPTSTTSGMARMRIHLLRRPRRGGSVRRGLLRPEAQLVVRGQPLLQLALALELRVELGAEQQREVREPHPDE